MSRESVSASSSSSSLFSSSGSATRPQQHSLKTTPQDYAVRQTPPSWRHSYVTPRRLPLVLDPSSTTSGPPLPPRSVAFSEGDNTGALRLASGSVRKMLEAATQRTPQSQQHEKGTTSQYTAASFARTAPRAGFLSKYGSNIPEFKRRFFVLKPSTHLYYFLSPADVEPRGCIDLEGSTVEDLEHLADGRFRFQILLEDGRRILLEARSENVGRQWMDSIEVERLSHEKSHSRQLEAVNAQQKSLIADLGKRLEEYKLVEKDRDGALEDAANWKSQFERLNEGLRLLTQHLRRAPTEEEVKTENDKEETEKDEKVVVNDNDSDAQVRTPDEKGDEMAESPEGEKGEPSHEGEKVDAGDSADDNKVQATPTASKLVSSTPQTSHRETSLLDDIDDGEQQIDDLEFPGTHFSALSNACQQLRESVRLASVEASSAVEDLNAANDKMMSTEKRMRKAEKHICKLWEENCAIRKTLKQTKAEKRVLVKEVKSLMSVVNETSEKLKQHTALPQNRPPSVVPSEDGQRNVSPSEEERLIDELEEHVMTSIRLHEQFLGVNNGLADQLMASVKKIETGSYTENDSDDAAPTFADNDDDDDAAPSRDSPATPRIQHRAKPPEVISNVSTDAGESEKLSPIKPTLLSLFDDDDSDDEDSEDDDGEETSTAPSFISSVGAELGDAYDDLTEDGMNEEMTRSIGEEGGTDPHISLRVGLSSSAFTPLAEDDEVDLSTDERKHPLLRLDEEADDEGLAPNLCASSTQSESSKSVVTDNGNATSRLICPLADVVGTRRKKKVDEDFAQDGKVYHVTFYSRKIGIQFQKVPAASTSKGLLTEAMTADLPTSADAGAKSRGGSTAAELKRIAAISSMASSTTSTNKEDEVCQVATPVDAVLVCGLNGFDDKANHVRPNLGARLVAFDGISVEVGRWTFDSVRKAIQARGRPLTLSFRNDFLTTKQRAILTKAVADVEKAIPPPRRTIQYKFTQRPPSAEPESIVSSQSHETEQFVNDAHPADEDDMSVSVASSYGNNYGFSQSFSTSHSVTSYGNYRSFSEAGSSSVFSSTLGPLVGNLMTGLSKNNSDGVPNYLRPDAESLENVPYHHDFTSSLL